MWREACCCHDGKGTSRHGKALDYDSSCFRKRRSLLAACPAFAIQLHRVDWVDEQTLGKREPQEQGFEHADAHRLALVHSPQNSNSFHNLLLAKHTNANNHSASALHLNNPTTKSTMSTGVWSREEHDKFLDAIQKYPQGPWRLIAECIGTRSLRQVQTHAQKYHEKIVRRMRGLRKDRRNAVEHRIDDATLEVCRLGEGFGLITPGRIVQPRSPGLEQQQVAGECSFSLQATPELPSLDESLDFLIEYLSAEVLGSDDDLEFDLGDIWV